MKVNKSKLIISGVALAILVLVGGSAIYYIQSKKQELQRVEEVKVARTEMLESIYKDLLSDYIRYVDQAMDWEYSKTTRNKAVIKLNSLLGENYFERNYDGNYCYGDKLVSAKTDKYALRLLRNQAKLQLVRKIYER